MSSHELWDKYCQEKIQMVSPLYDRQGKPLKVASLYREPISPSLKPTALEWEPANIALHSVLVDVFGAQGVFLVASYTSAAQISYCRMTDADRDVDLFIKIVPKRLASGLKRSRSISDYVCDSGLLTPVCTSGFPKVCIDGRVIHVYPFVNGCYLNNSISDLQMLGGALARLHKNLARYPDVHKVARSQREMRSRMRRKAKALLVDKCWASGELSPVRNHIQQWLEIDIILNRSECQVIHNDLNAGNVLKDTNGDIWFLDFEESRWSYLPSHFDIAKVIERFILVNDDWDVQRKIIASKQFMDAYVISHGNNYALRGSIPVALGWLLGFSWLRLSSLLFDRASIQHPEVRKFLHLAELLERNESWLAAL